VWKFYQLFYRSTNDFHIWWDFPYQSKNRDLYPAPRIYSRSHKSAHMRSICIKSWAKIINLGNIIQRITDYIKKTQWTNVIHTKTNGSRGQVLPPFQTVSCFGFPRYIAFAMHKNICAMSRCIVKKLCIEESQNDLQFRTEGVKKCMYATASW
jgi:hypothetical protein